MLISRRLTKQTIILKHQQTKSLAIHTPEDKINREKDNELLTLYLQARFTMCSAKIFIQLFVFYRRICISSVRLKMIIFTSVAQYNNHECICTYI